MSTEAPPRIIEDDAPLPPGTSVSHNRTERRALAPPSEGTSAIAGMLQSAIDKGTPIEQLSKLVDLYERMEAREAAKLFNAALAQFQKECPPIRRTSSAKITSTRGGSSFTIKYAELDEIARTVNPICAKVGLSYTWDAKVNDGAIIIVCYLRHEAGHVVTSTIELPVDNPSAMSPQQKVGSALTYGKRQTLTAVLGLTTSEDEPEAVEANPNRIHPDAVIEIEDLVTESGANKQKFLAHMNATSIADIREVDYQKAKSALEQLLARRQQQRGAAPAPTGARR